MTMQHNGIILNGRVYFQGQVRGATSNADGTVTIKIDCQQLPDEVTGRLVAGLAKKHVGVIIAEYEILTQATFGLLDEAVRVVSDP